MSIAPDWNAHQARLRETIKRPELFEEARDLMLSMHRSVHFSEPGGAATLMDMVWDGLRPEDFSVMPTPEDATIAWDIWHITRIEDLTVNILINRSDQILDDSRLGCLGVAVTDTGNAMTDDEITALSRSIDIEELKKYRIETGRKTQEILAGLRAEDVKRKVESSGLDKIRRVGGVTEHPESKWLLEFWGRKDVAGLILMPVTRHQLVHLNDCENLKKKIRSGRGRGCF
jgi:hypothetical protein